MDGDPAYRVPELRVPLLRGPLVYAENALVFPRERVPEGILQQAARTHDDRRLAEILDELPELLLDLVRKGTREHLLLEHLCHLEVALGRLLLHAQFPPAVLDQVGVEHV